MYEVAATELNLQVFNFFNAFSPQAVQGIALRWLVLSLCVRLNRSECEGRQNARPRVRFDKIFASFSSFGKGRASPA